MGTIKKIIRKYYRRWAREFFLPSIRVLWVQRSISGHDLVMMRDTDVDRMTLAIKRDLIRSIAEKLEEEDMIEFEETNTLEMGRIIRAKLRVI